eukprot:Gb_21574 [translate_table: standard]
MEGKRLLFKDILQSRGSILHLFFGGYQPKHQTVTKTVLPQFMTVITGKLLVIYLPIAVQWHNTGFIFMNTYLDIAEAIDDKHMGVTTEHLFEQSDIPAEFPIPDRHSVTEEKREEARDWLIQLSMDEKFTVLPTPETLWKCSLRLHLDLLFGNINEYCHLQVEEVLPMRKCDSCGVFIFEVSLVCYSCKDKSEACSVTGYPILQTECMQCNCCHKLANKDDWNTYIGAFHSCPWCNNPN